MKSYVSMEQHVCVVCCKRFDTNAILFDRRLKDSMETKTVTGWGLCPDDEKLYQDGYIALISIDLEKSEQPLTPASAFRTGDIMHIKQTAYTRIFGPDPEGPMAFVEDDVITKLTEMAKAQEA